MPLDTSKLVNFTPNQNPSTNTMNNPNDNPNEVSSPASQLSHGQQTVGSGGWIGSSLSGAALDSSKVYGGLPHLTTKERLEILSKIDPDFMEQVAPVLMCATGDPLGIQWRINDGSIGSASSRIPMPYNTSDLDPQTRE